MTGTDSVAVTRVMSDREREDCGGSCEGEGDNRTVAVKSCFLKEILIVLLMDIAERMSKNMQQE